MFLVGGGILTHNVPGAAPRGRGDLPRRRARHSGRDTADLVVGVIAGAVVLCVVNLIGKLRRKATAAQQTNQRSSRRHWRSVGSTHEGVAAIPRATMRTEAARRRLEQPVTTVDLIKQTGTNFVARIASGCHAADRCVDAHDICLRAAPGSGHFLVSGVCNCGTACDYRRGAAHFREPDRARVDVDRIHCQFCRLFLTAVLFWPYNLYLLAGAWLIIAVTLGIVVARAVFGRGRISLSPNSRSHPSVPVDCGDFATLFAFVGLSISDAFKGITFGTTWRLPAHFSI